MAGEAAGGEKQGLAGFWQKGKERLKDKIGGHDESGDQDAATEDSPESKHQSRRAQVRSAQIRHRQRKAIHQKQLEDEVNHYRSLIADEESETRALRTENAAMRARLSELGVYVPPLTGWHGHVQQAGYSDFSSLDKGGSSSTETPEMFGNVNVDDLTITLGMDDTLRAPAFAVSSGSSAGGGSSNKGSSPAVVSEMGLKLTPEQEHAAINFILALEHICWNHYWLGDFPHHHNDNSNITPHANSAHEEAGHALMATAIVMQNAPADLYVARDALSEYQERPASSPTPPRFQWQSPGMSLQALYGLASSVNPGEKELTPVQAWFELAERYGPSILLDGRTLENLKREFKGVVKCVAFGAAVEKQAFESVIWRALGGH